MRILASTLADAPHNISVDFIVEGSADAVEWARQGGFLCRSMGQNVTVAKEAEYIATSDADLFIIDLLHIDDKRFALYRNDPRPVVLFNDMAEGIYSCDLLIEPQTLTSTCAKVDGTVLRGPSYFIVHPAYADVWAAEKIINAPAKSLLISMGGEANPKAIASLSKAVGALAPQWETIEWVLGRCPDDVRSSLAHLPSNVICLGFVDDMATRLQKADLTIIAGGFIKFDAACCGTPSIIIAQYEHQESLGRSFEATGAASYLGSIEYLKSDEIVHHVSQLQKNTAQRQEMSRAGKKLVDGRGADRVLRHIVDLLPSSR